MFENLSGFMCEIISFLTQEWVFYMGCIGIALGALALANEETKLSRWASGLILGIGLATASVSMAEKLVPNMTSKCSIGDRT